MGPSERNQVGYLDADGIDAVIPGIWDVFMFLRQNIIRIQTRWHAVETRIANCRAEASGGGEEDAMSTSNHCAS